ncbi:MAG: hypothetical protein AB8G05_10545 [Oligoflexales bacterium]
MSKPRSYFEKLGFSTDFAPLVSGGSVLTNGKKIGAYLEQQEEDFILLCHSKGGLDFLAAYTLSQPRFSSRLKGVIFSQTPRGPSVVMEELLGNQKNLSTWPRKATNILMLNAIKLTGHLPGGRCLTKRGFDHNRRFFSPPAGVPILAVATWSIKASSWVDSYHTRLTAAHPGLAHDGQFYLQDQLWSSHGEQLVLGGVDHAQPAMGGLGFNHVRYWQSLVNMLSKRL